MILRAWKIWTDVSEDHRRVRFVCLLHARFALVREFQTRSAGARVKVVLPVQRCKGISHLLQSRASAPLRAFVNTHGRHICRSSCVNAFIPTGLRAKSSARSSLYSTLHAYFELSPSASSLHGRDSAFIHFVSFIYRSNSLLAVNFIYRKRSLGEVESSSYPTRR